MPTAPNGRETSGVARSAVCLDIRIISATTGQLLRVLPLDPTRNHQATGNPATHAESQQPEP